MRKGWGIQHNLLLAHFCSRYCTNASGSGDSAEFQSSWFCISFISSINKASALRWYVPLSRELMLAKPIAGIRTCRRFLLPAVSTLLQYSSSIIDSAEFQPSSSKAHSAWGMGEKELADHNRLACYFMNIEYGAMLRSSKHNYSLEFVPSDITFVPGQPITAAGTVPSSGSVDTLLNSNCQYQRWWKSWTYQLCCIINSYEW